MTYDTVIVGSHVVHQSGIIEKNIVIDVTYLCNYTCNYCRWGSAKTSGRVHHPLEHVLANREDLEAIGADISSLREEFSQGADISVKADLALRSVINQENLGPDEEKLEEYFSLLGAQMGSDSEQARDMLTNSGRLLDLEADLGKQAAVEWLYERAKIVDDEGQSISQSDLEPPEEILDEEEDKNDTDIEGDEE